LGGEYIRKLREVEIQYKILQFITPLYEQAKVEEQRSTPSVIVLDYASPAERKAKPKRLFIILAGALIGVFGTFLYTALYERLSNEKKNDTALYQSLLSLSLAVQNDIRSFYKKFR
jgi:uncharacterized protein involved in exopolysaccharide biosynthesis